MNLIKKDNGDWYFVYEGVEFGPYISEVEAGQAGSEYVRQVTSQSIKLFPILSPHEDGPKSIPWYLIEPHEEQALKNHYQTLNRLAERGGLSYRELEYLMKDERWKNTNLPVTILEENSRQWLINYLKTI